MHLPLSPIGLSPPVGWGLCSGLLSASWSSQSWDWFLAQRTLYTYQVVYSTIGTLNEKCNAQPWCFLRLWPCTSGVNLEFVTYTREADGSRSLSLPPTHIVRSALLLHQRSTWGLRDNMRDWANQCLACDQSKEVGKAQGTGGELRMEPVCVSNHMLNPLGRMAQLSFTLPCSRAFPDLEF